jgi:predicted lipoprotein with Yx(FWY)xxD motif
MIMKTQTLFTGARRRIGVLLVPTVLLVGAAALGAAIPVANASASHKAHKPKLVVFSASQTGLGTILTTQGGYTLYVYTGDTQNNSVEASQTTAPAWPPFLLPAGDVLFAGRGIVGLGTFTLPNGQVQVTWQGLPLYTFIKDTAAHVVNGQGKAGFVTAFVALQKKK